MTDHHHQNALRNSHQPDQQALEQIFDTYYPGILHYICFRLGPGELSDQACSEVFHELLDTMVEKPGSISDMRTWLYETACSTVESYLRRTEDAPTQMREQFTNPNSKQKNESTWLEDLVIQSLSRLIDEQQHLLTLRFAGPQSTDAIAKIMGKPIAEIKSMQVEALLFLRRYLEEES
jgi:RNA polymerase sigma factor (sigma-70 family)